VKGAVVVALIAATPPTVGALLTYVQARVAQREAARDRASATARTLEILGGAIERLQETTDRVETGIADLRERVGHLEGAAMGATRARRLRA
jgi:hypothetical protein